MQATLHVGDAEAQRRCDFGRGQTFDVMPEGNGVVVGISVGTFIVYMDAHDEAGRFDGTVFAFWEIVLLAIILTLFFLYSRKKS